MLGLAMQGTLGLLYQNQDVQWHCVKDGKGKLPGFGGDFIHTTSNQTGWMRLCIWRYQQGCAAKWCPSLLGIISDLTGNVQYWCTLDITVHFHITFQPAYKVPAMPWYGTIEKLFCNTSLSQLGDWASSWIIYTTYQSERDSKLNLKLKTCSEKAGLHFHETNEMSF